ncbi:MAG: TlpA family protein disulfide reductase [Gemmatimonadaceae bacterium]|nr:TlpA family protein disulfide reductase [Gemmatimonadaceae bacterium]
MSKAAVRSALIAVVCATVSMAASARAQDFGLPVGSVAPVASVQALDGSTVSLAQYVGKGPVLIQFWAAWCATCRQLMPSFERAKQLYGTRVKFVAIAVSANESLERVRRYSAAHKFTHQVLYDARGEAVDRFNVPATSYIVVLDRRGRIVYTGVGGDQDIVAAARKAL